MNNREEFRELYGQMLPACVDVNHLFFFEELENLHMLISEEGTENIYDGFKAAAKDLEDVWNGFWAYVMKYGQLLDKLGSGSLPSEELDIREMEHMRGEIEKMQNVVKYWSIKLDQRLKEMENMVETARITGGEDWQSKIVLEDLSLCEWCDTQGLANNGFVVEYGVNGNSYMLHPLLSLIMEWDGYYVVCLELNDCLGQLLDIGVRYERLIKLGITKGLEEVKSEKDRKIDEMHEILLQITGKEVSKGNTLEVAVDMRGRWEKMYEELVNKGYIIGHCDEKGKKRWLGLIDGSTNIDGKIVWKTRWKLSYFIGSVVNWGKDCQDVDTDIWRFVIERFGLDKDNSSFKVEDLSTDWSKYKGRCSDLKLREIIEGGPRKVAR